MINPPRGRTHPPPPGSVSALRSLRCWWSVRSSRTFGQAPPSLPPLRKRRACGSARLLCSLLLNAANDCLSPRWVWHLPVVEVDSLGPLAHSRLPGGGSGAAPPHWLRPRTGGVRQTSALVALADCLARRRSRRILLSRLCHRTIASRRSQPVLGRGHSARHFSIGHWTGGLANIVIALALGAILTGFYLWRRDLVANMFGHWLVDFVGNILPKLFS